MLIFSLLPMSAFAKPIKLAKKRPELWKVILAEAASEGYYGMYAVTCVVKNRKLKGMKHGLCAANQKNLDRWVYKQPKKYRVAAQKIVEQVMSNKGKDVTGGATHYENIEKFGRPYWVKGMIRTVKIGNHVFYKKDA